MTTYISDEELTGWRALIRYALLAAGDNPPIFLDVGSNSGEFANLVSAVENKSEVHLFDPLYDIDADLRKGASECVGRLGGVCQRRVGGETRRDVDIQKGQRLTSVVHL